MPPKRRQNKRQKSKDSIKKPGVNKELFVKDTDHPYIRDLIQSINSTNLINKDGMLFIIKHGLTKVECDNKEDLPLELYFGTVYVIKNDTIIGVNTSITEEPISIIFPDRKTVIKTDVTVYNLDPKDINIFRNPSMFENMDGMTSYDISNTENFVWALASNGFDIYIR